MFSSRSNSEVLKYKQKIGCMIQIPNIGRGQLKFVGTVDNKPGYYAGVDLLAPIGKNNGTFNGRRYFNTEYPKSGLFIQLPKIAHLIDQAELTQPLPSPSQQRSSSVRKLNITRRTTLGGFGETLHNRNTTVNRNNYNYTMPIDSTADTPTPNRNGSMFHSGPLLNDNNSNNNHNDHETNSSDMDISRNSIEGTDNHNNYNKLSIENSNENVQLLKEYELKIERQTRKLIEYERLLTDQRMVLEEIQPTIDEYDKRVNDLELERNNLKDKLAESQAEFERQLKYFETENKQLTDVVSQLNEDLRANEEYIQQQQSASTMNTNLDIDIEEMKRQIETLTKYKNDMENAKVKWNKERDQLKMHNESLSKEYQILNKEYMVLLSNSNNNNSESSNYEKVIQENRKLKDEISQLKSKVKQMEVSNTQSLPPYIPPVKVDATAGRELWCSLCEKSGHNQVDCPYQYEPANRPHNSTQTISTSNNNSNNNFTDRKDNNEDSTTKSSIQQQYY